MATNTRMAPAPELAEGYYLENLEHVVNHALGRYAHVLDAAESGVLGRFLGLSRDARRLYARLYLRRGPLFRRSQLRYAEIADADAAVDELEAAGLAAWRAIPTPPEDCAPFLALFTAEELKAAARGAGLRAGGRKADVAGAVSACAEALAALGSADTVVERLLAETFQLAQLLFFGNLGQDLSEFVLVSLDRARYPAYELARDLPLFASRGELTAFLEAAAFAAEEPDEADAVALGARAGLALAGLAASRPTPAHAWRLNPGRYYARSAFACARCLERLGEADAAMRVYCALVRSAPQAGVRADAADRLGLVAARAGAPERFREACDGLSDDPTLDAIAHFAIASRSAALSGAPSPRRALRQPETVDLAFRPAGHAGSKALYEGPCGDPVTVEEAALQALGGGLHAENSLYRSLFGLLFWDVVFARVPGMFQHRFQSGPLDLSSEHFYATRRRLFDERLAELSAADLSTEVRAAWGRHAGLTNAFVAWDAYEPDQLATAAGRLGARLLPLLERLARNPKRHGRGLPDLLVLAGDGAVLVEVKGPGDQPQLEQRLWHDALLGMGLDVRIARVRRMA